jgi:AAA+ ATPase superfamily predicted ATPase
VLRQVGNFCEHTTGPKNCGKSSFHRDLLNEHGGQVLLIDLRDKHLTTTKDLVLIMADQLVSPGASLLAMFTCLGDLLKK